MSSHDRITKAIIGTVTDFSATRNNSMPGKYNIFDEHDIPEDLRKLLQKREIDEPEELILPKEYITKKWETDQIDALKRQMEWERKKFEQNDPVHRELRDLRNEVEHLKDAMRRIGVLLDTDLPDPKAFEEFKMLREAFKKYKMVEHLVLGDDK